MMRAAASGFFDHIDRKHLTMGAGIIFAPLAALVILGVVFLEPQPITPETVMGCYTAKGAPPLVIERDRIRIAEPEARTFHYLAEPDKTGYRLAVTPALGLEPSAAGKYAFVRQKGVGYFWTLLPELGSSYRKLRNPEDYGGRFEIVARDGVTMIYARSDMAERCN
ncbi:MAG: hypothetical protein ACK4NZ_14615 [Tsuneonella sp.]